MKIISATSETPGMTKEEVDKFLAGNLMLQMATIDKQGEPNIQPVWFYYDKKGEKLLVTTSKLAKKVLVIIGAQKVPREVYTLADYNVAIGNQPHSEIGALSVFLDRIFKGEELKKNFRGGKLRIIPNNKGKYVKEANDIDLA